MMIFLDKKANLKVEETAPSVATGVILSLHERLKKCDVIESLNGFGCDDLNLSRSLKQQSLTLRSGMLHFRMILSQHQLEKARKKEAAFIVAFAKRKREIAELKSAVRKLRAQLKSPSMQNLVEEKDKKVKELQDNVAAVNFTLTKQDGEDVNG